MTYNSSSEVAERRPQRGSDCAGSVRVATIFCAPEGMTVVEFPAMANLFCMLNTTFWVEIDVDKRAFLYLDSVLLSGELD